MLISAPDDLGNVSACPSAAVCERATKNMGMNDVCKMNLREIANGGGSEHPAIDIYEGVPT